MANLISIHATNLLNFIRLRFILLMAILAVEITACDIYNPKVTTPAYIRIDSMPFVGSPSTGGKSQHITDVWVYANNQILGVFTPDSIKPIPVIGEGLVTISVAAGVFTDGVKGNRVYYPFFKQYTEAVSLTKGHTTKIRPFASYDDSLKIPFTWYQDFERSDSGTSQGAYGTAPIVRTAFVPGGDTAKYGSYYALVKSANATDVLMLTHNHFFPLRQNGMPVYLEMDYKSTCDLFVGLQGSNGSSSDYTFDLVLKPVANWTKVYVSFSDETQKFLSGTQFRFFIRSSEAPGIGNSFSVDNLKLIQQ